MHLHYLTLKRQVEFLQNNITDCQIVDSYTHRKNEWVIELEDKSGKTAFLQLCCDAQYPYILYLEHHHRAKNSTGVLKELIGKRIGKPKLLPNDRIIEIPFSNFQDRLFLQFFTAKTNFFWVDKNLVILNCFKGAKKHSGASYKLPETDRVDPSLISQSDFVEFLCLNPHYTLEKSLKHFQYMTGPVISSVLFQCGAAKQSVIRDLSDQQLDNIRQSIQMVLKVFQHHKPLIYYQDGIADKFALAPLLHLKDQEYKEFDSINQTLRVFCYQALKHHGFHKKKKHYRDAITRKLNSLYYSLSKLDNQPQDPKKSEYYQKIGKLLTSQPHPLKTHSSKIELTDYFDPELKTVTVTVNPDLTILQNAEKFFQKARRYQQRNDQNISRKKNISKQIDFLKDLLQEADQSDNLKKMARIEEKLKSLHLLSPLPTDGQTYRLPYKCYSFKGFDIWIGRSARDNDALTFKCANKEDFWLHVQGYSGSHVVIRNPHRLEAAPHNILEHAAQLAVTFSLAKHASYVPVIYTNVKYVRKPKKSAPGAVTPERVKTLFADPLKSKD